MNYMKKLLSILFVTVLVSTILTGCTNFVTKSSNLQVVVVSCEENFYINYNYERLARNHADSYYWHNYYMKLAIENGCSDYTITVKIEDLPYTFVSKTLVDVGDTVTIIKEDTYYDGELIDTDYKLGS